MDYKHVYSYLTIFLFTDKFNFDGFFIVLMFRMYKEFIIEDSKVFFKKTLCCKRYNNFKLTYKKTLDDIIRNIRKLYENFIFNPSHTDDFEL